MYPYRMSKLFYWLDINNPFDFEVTMPLSSFNFNIRTTYLLIPLFTLLTCLLIFTCLLACLLSCLLACFLTILTYLQHLNDVNLKSTNNTKYRKPKWMVQLSDKINRLKRDIAHIELIQKCKQTNSYTASQKRIHNRMIWKYRNIKQHTLI